MSIADRIRAKLSAALDLTHIEIINESHMHRTGPNAESHFKLVVVTDDFLDKMPVKRHQQIYAILAEELEGEVHALALHTYTPQEWEEVGKAPDSPNCGGGH